MRATEFHFDCRSTLADLLATADGRELDLSCADGLAEGDWLLVTFRVPNDATCLAARVVLRDSGGGHTHFGVEFAEHDWERLLTFAAVDTAERSAPPSRQTPLCSVCPPSDTHVLIVHDDPAVADVLGRMLSCHGFRTTWVSTAREAFDSLHAERVDLVLADWSHGTAGQEFCAELTSHCSSCDTRRPPVVFLACPSARADRPTALKAGADDFVVVPFRWKELDARLLSLLRRAS